MDKNSQRQICLKNRKALSDNNRQAFSNIINSKLLPFIKDKVVCSYKPSKYEVNVLDIDNACYPVILDNNNMKAYRSNTFHYNKYNILEPNIDNAQLIEDIDVVIVPLVGFDEKCNRLGHGKGYYDRFLKNTKALKIGIGFEIQKLDQIIIDDNDIKLDYIITEKNIYKK